MRKALLLFAVLGLVGSLWAADPIIGTWKLNLAKSKLSPGLLARLKQPLKEWTEIYREIEGDQIELTSTEDNRKVVWPCQGGMVTVKEGDPLTAIHIETLTEPGNWYVTLLRDGKQGMIMHKTFSKDGKTMLQTRTVRNPQGEFITVLVFERQ